MAMFVQLDESKLSAERPHGEGRVSTHPSLKYKSRGSTKIRDETLSDQESAFIRITTFCFMLPLYFPIRKYS